MLIDINVLPELTNYHYKFDLLSVKQDNSRQRNNFNISCICFLAVPYTNGSNKSSSDSFVSLDKLFSAFSQVVWTPQNAAILFWDKSKTNQTMLS